LYDDAALHFNHSILLRLHFVNANHRASNVIIHVLITRFPS
jgi:hypothetical protein